MFNNVFFFNLVFNKFDLINNSSVKFMDGNYFLSFTCLMVYCHSPTKVSQRIVISMISVKFTV